MRTLLLLLACSVVAPTAVAGGWADVEIYDRQTHAVLPTYVHRGKRYVVGTPGNRYEIRIRNRSGQRLLAVTSVDGINAISGETASEQQSGYVLGSRESVVVDGWRKSLDDVATFYFTSLPNSYAARTNRPDNVGVIGVAFFRERIPCCQFFDSAQEAARAPSSQSRDTSEESRAEQKLGTGHGPRESSLARYVDFERASKHPDDTIVIYYDSQRNLINKGVLPRAPRRSYGPKAFPNSFVPDP